MPIAIPKEIVHQKSNDKVFFQIFDFTLSEDEMTKIWALNRDFRVYKEEM